MMNVVKHVNIVYMVIATSFAPDVLILILCAIFTGVKGQAHTAENEQRRINMDDILIDLFYGSVYMNEELEQTIEELQNDLKQAQNEIKLLNKQIDNLIEENKQLKLRNKMLTKIGFNSIYGINCYKNYCVNSIYGSYCYKNHCVYTDTDSISQKVRMTNMTIIINYINAGVQKAEIIENITGVIKNDNGFLVVKGNDTKRYDENTITSFCILRGVKDE